MDEFEKHIRNGREGMDIHEPDPGLWSRIEAELPRRERHIGSYIWKAAVILIVAGAGLTLIIRTINAPERNANPQIAAVRETYVYYNSQISLLYAEAGPLLTDNPDISMELDKSMSELDSLSVEIRKDLNDNIANEEVVEALIRNYRLRIQLLEDMLVLMKEKETETENKNYSDHEL
jgi:hypothetical protein